jgi:multiple sugar transport system permease protein
LTLSLPTGETDPSAVPALVPSSTAVRSIRRRRGWNANGHTLTAWAMVLPSVLFFCAFVFYPVGNAFYVSLTSWDLVSPPRFIGLRNYERLLTDANFLHSAWVTVY